MQSQHIAVTIRQSVQTYAALPAMRYKQNNQWQTISYQTMGERGNTVARALLALGVQPGDRIGIFAENRPEWALADFGILSVGGVCVPIYATNTKLQAAYIVEETAMTILFTGGQEHYDKIQAVIERMPCLRTIVSFDEEVVLQGEHSLHFSQFLQLGADPTANAEIDGRLAAASAEDLATIIYTSGTTGEPKGVMLTHANLYHQFTAMDGQFTVGPNDRSLCFLPLTHVYERTWSYFVFKCGAVNYYLTNPKAVIETMQEVRPTVMVSVPRLYEKVYAAAYAGLEQGSDVKRRLFHWAIGVGSAYQYGRKENRPIGPWLKWQHRLADRLVLCKIRDVVGGPKNFFSAGGAPLARSIEEFFFAAGLLVCEGYGLTETSPMITFNTPKAFKFGTGGRPIPGCQVKFGADGEILVKSPSVTQGYYNKPEATADAFVDGWFRTGDVGEFDDEGFLRITDRIKDLIITSAGKNIAPQRIETAVAQDHYIEQFIAIGDKRKFVSALVVPNFAALQEYAQAQQISFGSVTELVQNPKVVAFYRERIDAASQELANYERVKAFTLLPAPFTQETGELTPTQKIRRKIVAEKYAALVDAMYPPD